MAVGSSSGCFAEWAADVEHSAAGEIGRRAVESENRLLQQAGDLVLG